MQPLSAFKRYPRAMVFTNGGAPIAASRHVLHGNLEPHSHDFIEIAVIVSGRGVHSSAYGNQPLQVGDAFVLRCGAWHAYLDCEDLSVYNCLFGAELLHGELAWCRNEPVLDRLFWSHANGQRHGVWSTRLPLHILNCCLEHLGNLARLDQDGLPLHRVAMFGHLLLFLNRLTLSPPVGVVETVSRGQMHPAVATAMQLLEDNLNFPWTLAELAYQLHIDRSYLVRLFKTHARLSPMAYLAERRAERAAELLLQTPQPISQIAECVGWSDPNYFARRFRAHFGMSASAYRSYALDK